MVAADTRFYVTGGTLRQDARSYVERQADRDLFEGLLQGEYCYVLHARQMGKSSLMVHTTARLREEGVAVAAFELTALGQHLTVEQWYDGMLSRIGRELDLEDELEDYWLEHERVSPLQRWMGALQEVVLARCPGPIVICLDEIDAVRSLPFSSDEFFAAIRECYNRRTQDPEFQRLTFCLLGVATPSDLIQDTRTTPFNIGRRIELTDFTPQEAAPLARGIADGGLGIADGETLLQRILYWTSGHPYLTQRLCQAVAGAISQDPNPQSAIRGASPGCTAPPFVGADTASVARRHCPQSVDRLCAALFLTHGAPERDDNLLFVRERLLKSEADRASVLELYRHVRRRHRVRDDTTNPLVSLLRLSGITRTVAGYLRVRNRIYARVFDAAWVTQNMPDAELRRQRAAFRNGFLRSAALAGAIVAVIGALALSAVSERDRARRLLYVADMNLAQQALSEGNAERAEELLDEHRPGTARGADLRGFEWRYLWRLCQEDALATFPENAGAVWGVAYSPDGRTLAAVNEDGTVKLWDVVTKAPVATLAASLMQRSKGVSVAFSPDGRLLAANSNITGIDCAATLWDVAIRRELKTFSPCPGGSLAFSPDGKLLAAAGWSGTGGVGPGTVMVWDVTTRQEVVTFRWPGPLWSAVFSPDSTILATVVENKAVGLWSVAARRRVALLPAPPKAWIQAAAFSPDGKTLATCSDDQSVTLWSVPETSPRHLSTRPAGPTPRTSGGVGTLGAKRRDRDPPSVVPPWGEPSAWRVVATLQGSHRHEVGVRPFARRMTCSLAFSPNGKKLATASWLAREVTLWDLDTKKKIATLRGHKEGVYSLAFSPDSATLATGSADGTMKLWSTTPTREEAALGRLRSEVLALAFSPDSQALATGNADGTVTVCSTAAGPALTILRGHSGSVRSVAFSRDGKLLASGGNDGAVRLWDVAFRHRVATLAGHKDHVWCVAFSPDGKTLASGGEDGSVKLWDLAAETEISTLRTGAGVVMSLSFSPDGRLLALGTNENSVKLWDLRSRQEVASLLAHTSSVTATAFSPDGKILASGSGGADNTVVLWDVAARQPLARLKGCKGRVNSVAFSPDGKTLAGGSSDTSVRLWNVATGREVGTLKGPRGPVSCVAFSPDGSTLAAGGKNPAIGLWRAASFAETDARHISTRLPPGPR